MLIDHANILVRSGKGGDGAVAFRREKYIPKGGPKGGDGGNGGSVILVADANVSTLLDFAGKPLWAAEDGGPGAAKQCHGGLGADLRIHVPPGTLVYDDDSGELLGDLDAAGKELLVAKGGRGGFGNEHFKSSTNQTPRNFTPGEPAEEKRLRLELKLIADVGLVGLPNAGKSTLLAAISRARPKVADYPFTTLAPHLGIAELPARRAESRRLIFADIPGLIEGAHRGAGLGIQFLRHIERTRLLVHLIDVDPADGSDPVRNYQIIEQELSRYSAALAAKPRIVVLNKMDLVGGAEDRAAAAAMIGQAIGVKPLTISAATGVGVPAFLEECWKQVQSPKSKVQSR